MLRWGSPISSEMYQIMSKRSRNALAWEMTWDELILQECHHIQDGGRNMYHLKKIAGMFNLLSTLRLLWNQHEPTAPLPRLSFDHRDTGGSPLSSRGWAHQTADNSLGQVSVKDHPIIPTGIPAFTKNYTNFMEKTHGSLYLSKT